MRFLVLQHVECEGPGVLACLMRGRGVALDTVRLYAGDRLPESLAYDGLLVMGGPMSVYDEAQHPFLVEENEFIRKAVTRGVPFLGICLGGQLLAKALGAAVALNVAREIGFYHVELTEEGWQDPLFRGLASPLPVFQWHSDSFDIPSGGVRLATSEACANQAFRYAEKAYALQFHLEVTPTMLREWVDAYQKEPESAELREAVLPREVEGRCEVLRAVARTLFDNFLSLVQRSSGWHKVA